MNSPRATTGLIGLVVVLFSAVGGAALRDRIDGGAIEASAAERGPLLASASKSAGAEPSVGDYFYQLSRLLKREYVEPITDDQKLATGGVRGMIASLADPYSQYYDKAQFANFLDNRTGKFQGIGVEVNLVMTGPVNANPVEESDGEDMDPEAELVRRRQVPRLMITRVIPNSAAAKAGVKLGDLVYSVDGQWVVNTGDLVKFQQAQRDFRAKKITIQQLNEMRNDMRDKMEKALMPLRAKERIVTGKTGTVKLTLNRPNVAKPIALNLAKGTWQAEGTRKLADGSVAVVLDGTAAASLKPLVSARTTLDLRNVGDGNPSAIPAVLATLLPKGTYGHIVSQRGNTEMTLEVKAGRPAKANYIVRVDSSTRGATAILAKCLQAAGAKLEGTLSAPAIMQEVVELPDQTGFTLNVGEWKPKAANGKVAMAEVKS
ncbi:MAG: PDZ domain-containing protein [Fimbriimonadaceae bacterium]|nr:PDZ domain-containing protein [Fimbriimonadaceae bacterium]